VSLEYLGYLQCTSNTPPLPESDDADTEGKCVSSQAGHQSTHGGSGITNIYLELIPLQEGQSNDWRDKNHWLAKERNHTPLG
jgi:hypothetical protein